MTTIDPVARESNLAKAVTITRRAVLILVTTCVLFPSARPQTKEDDILNRRGDEVARTLDERQSTLKALLAAARQNVRSDPLKAARYFNRAGRLHLQLNSTKDALATFRNALSMLPTAPPSNERIDLLNGMAATYNRLSKCEEAENTIREVLAASEQTGYVTGRAESLLTRSDCENYIDHAVAIRTAQEALQLWQSIGNEAGVARAHATIGDYQIGQNNIHEATVNNEAALALWRKLNVPSEEAQALINLGFIEYRKGAWQSCMSYLTRAQSLLDETAEPIKMGQITAGIAEAFIESGLPEAGLTKSEESRRFYALGDDHRGVATMTWEIGKIRHLLGDHSGALAELEQALNAAKAFNDVVLVAVCHDYLGRTYQASGDKQKALKHFEIALDLYNMVGNPREAERTRVLMALLFKEQGKVEQSRQELQHALSAFGRFVDRVSESATLYALGRLELDAQNLEAAEGYLQRSIDATENVRRVSTSSDLTSAFSATVYQRYQSYIELLMRKHQANPQSGFAVRAFETSELARARSLWELLRATQTNLAPGVDPELAAKEKSLRQSLRVKEDAKVRLLGSNYKKEDLQAIEKEISELEAEYKPVLESIMVRFPGYEQMAHPTALTLREIQERVVLNDETLLLEYSVGEERSYLWAVTRDSFSSYELPGRAEIEKSAIRVYELLRANQPLKGERIEERQARVRLAETQLPLAIEALSKVLLDPVADKLQYKRLLIVPDGALQYIPFQVLVAPTQSWAGTSSSAVSRPLIFDHEIVNEPSASILGLVASESVKRRKPAGSVAIMADPVFEVDDPRVESQMASTRPSTSKRPSEVMIALRDVNATQDDQIMRLPASREEAEAIMTMVPSGTGWKALDFEANRATATAHHFSQYRIVHFATHAVLNSHHPEYSGIVLSLVNKEGQPQDGFLRMADIYDLKLPVDLVVLSACETGLGRDVRGEGLIGLTRGFMYAGASSVVASLWKVDDQATAELMKLFYEGMFKHQLTPAAALRRAQIQISSQNRWRSPYYWAGFVIQGQYSDTEDQTWKPGGQTRLWPILAGGAALILAVFLYLRLRPSREH